MSETDIYRNLQRHLDTHPVGYPQTKGGVEIRLLKHFFTPQEAKMATKLSYKDTSLGKIYESVEKEGLSVAETENLLDQMVKKGIIGYRERSGVKSYRNMPLIVGMYEGQINKLTPEFLTDMEQYTFSTTFGLEFVGSGISQMRTIPIEESVTPDYAIATYDGIMAILDKTEGPFSIMNCICRQAAQVRGRECKKTSRLETCLAIEDFAVQVIKMGVGREVTREEAIRITKKNEEEGLVLQPENVQKPEFLCACCGCCCGMLRVLKNLPRPLDYWSTNYYAQCETESCTGCGKCVKICPLSALKIHKENKVSVIDMNRCIGCGVCVPSCPTKARSLVKREKYAVPPDNHDHLLETIMNNKKGKLGKLKVAAKMLLRL